MPRGLTTTTELARAVELLKTRDRNRQKELRAVRGVADSSLNLCAALARKIDGEPPDLIDVTAISSPSAMHVFGLSAEPGLVNRVESLEAYVRVEEKLRRCGTTDKPKRSFLDRFLDKWVRN